MADGDILGRIKAEYEEKRNRAANDRKKRINSVIKKYPRIGEIDDEIYRLGAENLGKIAADPDNSERYNNQLKAKYRVLYDEKNKIIAENKIDPDYDKEVYECKICSDTGYMPSGKRCGCFNQSVINEVFNMKDVIESMKTENFESFSYKYYSPDRSMDNISERENIRRIVKRAEKLCDNFDYEDRSLLFIGEPGLGKTFLSKSIAKRVMEKGKTVVYSRAGKLFGMMEDYKFGRDESRYKIDYIYSADLLVIDDLGTESRNTVNISFIDDVINERIDEGKKTVISTNLTMDEMSRFYSRRLVSRIIESFVINRFFGTDIRVQKL